MYKAASFFSGIGGLDLAFSWAGFDIVFHCEIEEYPRRILNKHRSYWPHARQLRDIKNVKRTHVGNVDVMFGGFPCQDISIAGKRAGITEGKRSGLWFEFLRLIGEIRPRVVVLENVSAIHVPTRDRNGDEQPSAALIVAATLSEVGYDAIWLPVRASDIGAPHQRERWFCVAYCQSLNETGNAKRDGTWESQVPSRNRDSDTRTPMAYTTNEWPNRGKWKPRNAAFRGRNRWRFRGTLTNGLTYFMENSCEQRCQERRESHTETKTGASFTCETSPKQRGATIESRLARTSDGTAHQMDRHKGQWPARPNSEQFDYEPRRVTLRRDNRVSRIKALGNMVVPQQAFPIANAVRMFLNKIEANND